MSTELQKSAGSFLAQRPAFIKESTAGHEGIANADVKPPSFKLAQSTSPETKRSKPDRYIEGLREGEFFNSLTKEIYGEGPVKIVIVKPLGHRNVEFDKDMKPVEFDIPDDDPRTKFTNKVVDGKMTRFKPVATKFLDYLILVTLADGSKKLFTFALKSTQLRKGVEINSIIRGNSLPCYAYEFTTTVVPEGKGQLSWYGLNFVPGWPTEETYLLAEKYYEEFKDKKVDVDDLEPESGTAAPADDDIPF